MAPTQVGYRERPYYFKFTHHGKPYARCLETNNAEDAQARAKLKYTEIVSAVTNQSYTRLDATKLRSANSATLEDIFTAYRTGPSEASAKTRELNINALKQICSGASVTSVRELTPVAVRQYFTAVQQVVATIKDQEASASMKRSANSRWAQARSLFTDRCLAHYEDLALINGPAALGAFVKAGNLASFNRIPKQNYNPPTEAIIAQTLSDWEKLEDRDMFLAIGHELAFGLRLAEIAQAQWNWHSQRNDYPVLDGRATVKGGGGLIQVRALDPYYSTMMRIGKKNDWLPKTSDSLSAAGEGQGEVALIIGGTATYRTDGLFRAISDWLRTHGWETQKTNHALRAYAGSQVAMRYGIYEAQMFLRHSTVKVTEQNYSHFVSKFKPSDLNTMPARWAVIPPPPTPKVSSAIPDATLDATHDFQHPPSPSITGIPWTMVKRN